MNLSSTIRRDGTKVFYLPEIKEVEAKPTRFEKLTKRLKAKIMPWLVGKTNGVNQPRKHTLAWITRAPRG